MALLIFIVILIVLVWVHELGHFSVAKLFGVRVDEFSIGFPPRLLSFVRGETRYSFGALLVGGYVKIFGEDPTEGAGNPRALTSKNRGVQVAVMLAGIAFNLIFAWLALSAGYMSGLPAQAGTSQWGSVNDTRVVVGAVLPASPAANAGLHPGDTIVHLQTQGAELDAASAGGPQAEVVWDFIAEHQDESLIITVLRDGKEEVFLAKPAAGIVEGRKVIGLDFGDVGILKLPVHQALMQGAVAAKNLTVQTAHDLGVFFSALVLGKADFSQVAGPIGIAGVGSSAVKAGFGMGAMVAALISINLALINLLPIPGLDGGRVLVLIVETIIRRPVNPRIINALMLLGLALIVVLMVVVSVHDIARLVG